MRANGLRNIISCGIFLLLFSCSNNNRQQQLLAATWFVTEHAGEKEEAGRVTTDIGKLYEGSFFNLLKNNTATIFLQSHFYSGRWYLEEEGELLVIEPPGQPALRLQIKNLTDNPLRLETEIVSTISQSTRLVLSLAGEPHIDTSDASDPFSLVNNQWRIKATHKETDIELLNRISNHTDAIEAFIKRAAKEKWNVADLRYFSSPFRFYEDGILLKALPKLPKGWNAVFYDSLDADRAYDWLGKLWNNDFRPESGMHDEYMYLSLLKQFRETLEAAKKIAN
jgi:hypothetical protein